MNGSLLKIDNPAFMPNPSQIEHIEEPVVKGQIILPKDYMGAVMGLINERRGRMQNMEYLDTERVMLMFMVPLNELITDFFDQMKSLSKGYASLDYEYAGYQPSDLIKLDILINQEAVDALSFIVHRDKAFFYGRGVVQKLREVIPRHQFEIPIQAAIGAKVIARETIKAIRKNVTAKCYGGDITRKRKLLERQKEGKKKMKNLGTVEVPKEAFMTILKMSSNE
jgi:GTP-binding protein LepA